MVEEIGIKQKSESGFSPRELVVKYIRFLPWVVISVAVFLILGYVKLRYSTPIYSVSGKLLVSRNNPYGGGGGGDEKFSDIFMMQNTGNSLNDQMEILRSRSISARVITATGLQTTYYNKGKVRASAVYNRDMPFVLIINRMVDSTKGFGLLVTILNDNEYTLNEQGKKYLFNEPVELNGVQFRLLRTNVPYVYFASKQFLVNWSPLEDAAAALSGSIKVAQAGDFTNVLALAYETESIPIGLDIVNNFMKEFQKASLEEKRLQAENALAFINDQLIAVRKELGGVEQHLQDFRETNRIFEAKQQSELLFGLLSESTKQVTEYGVKLKVIDYLTQYLQDKNAPNRAVPATLGIDEPSFLQQIGEYNKLQLERATAIKSTTPDNPYIKTLDAGMERVRQDILENLKNIRQTYVVATNDLQRKNGETDSQIKAIPSKEKRLLEVTREQNILQELYSFLLQKKLETSISSASTISNIVVLEPAISLGGPIAPNRKSTYLTAILIGLAIPIGIILLIEYLNDKVSSKQDIEKITSIPILGEVGHSDSDGALIVTAKNRNFIAEQFRTIRSNLQYILPKVEKPVLMVTSSFSGEGKSFISTNLGAVFSVSDKRTVILEFDIRKPKIMEGLGLKERKGLTNFIVRSVELPEIIYPVPGQDNMFVIPCGPVPPNPAEMLLNERVDELFAQLRQQFDIIIIDTAPVGLVSDSLTLGKYADAVVYIVRHNYTFRKFLQFANDLFVKKKLPHLSIVINDIKTRAGYGGYYGYGYGYGYGYSSHYFDNGTKKKGLFKRLTLKSLNNNGSNGKS
jgi:capsular exopolysaccharide synthesis family protein